MLDVRPDDQILEIGCGGGVAVSLICERLDRGFITAIDRSAKAVERAARRNAHHVAAGKARVWCLDLADAGRLGDDYDKVFAVNANLFWTRSADAELDVVQRLMRREATLCLCYEAPPGDTASRAAQRVTAALVDRGFTATTTYRSPALVWVGAALPTGGPGTDMVT